MAATSKPYVPIIDLSPAYGNDKEARSKLVAEVDQACRNVGFLVVKGHNIDQELLERFWSTTHKYFDLNADTKMELSMTDDNPFGYSKVGGETLSQSKGLTEIAPDLKEMFCVGRTGDTVRFPSDETLPNMAADWIEYYNAVNGVANMLLEIFTEALSLPKDFFVKLTDKHARALRALNYPEQLTPPPPGQMRASEHTDYGTVTILRVDGPGLQVIHQETGDWVTVELPKNEECFVVNLGDLMQRWTNDQFISTLHRVVAKEDGPSRRRQSVAFFHNLNPDAVCSTIPSCIDNEHPKKYDDITAGAHVLEKHLAATASGKY